MTLFKFTKEFKSKKKIDNIAPRVPDNLITQKFGIK